MDMVKQVEAIAQMFIDKEEKIRLLEELILDCYNDMEAQEENMRPEVKHNNAEGYRIAKNLIRELKT